MATSGSTTSAVAGFVVGGPAQVPPAARHEAGRQLNFIQHGGAPSDWKPLTTVGAGVIEIPIHADGEHRVLVVTKFDRGVYILHAFVKKSRKMTRRDLDLARRRYRELIGELGGQ
jgi:phage-related protein